MENSILSFVFFGLNQAPLHKLVLSHMPIPLACSPIEDRKTNYAELRRNTTVN